MFRAWSRGEYALKRCERRSKILTDWLSSSGCVGVRAHSHEVGIDSTGVRERHPLEEPSVLQALSVIRLDIVHFHLVSKL